MIGIVTYVYVTYSQLAMRLGAVERDDLLRSYSQIVDSYEKNNPNLPRKEILLQALLDFQTANNKTSPNHGQTSIPIYHQNTTASSQANHSDISVRLMSGPDSRSNRLPTSPENNTPKLAHANTVRTFAYHHDSGPRPTPSKQDNGYYKTVTPRQQGITKRTHVESTPSNVHSNVARNEYVVAVIQQNDNSKGNDSQEKCQTNGSDGLQQCLPGAIIIGQAKCGTSKLWNLGQI